MQGQGDAALSLGGPARAVEGPGPRVRLLPRPRLLQVPGQQLRDPPRRLRGPGQEGAVRGVSARLGDGPGIRPPQPARRDPHRARAVPGARLDARAAGRDRIDDGARQRVPRRLREAPGLGLARLRAVGACSSTRSSRSARSPSRSRRRTCSPTITSRRPTTSTTPRSRRTPTRYQLPAEFQAIDVEAIRARI